MRPVASQRQLAEAANRLTGGGNPRLLHRPNVSIESIDFDAATDKFLVEFDGDQEPQTFDRIVANVGYRPDSRLYEELQVRTHIRTGGPWGVGEQLIVAANTAASELSADRVPTRSLTTEPHFYILGAKSYGRDSSFLMIAGYEQIRDLFSIIGDRADLDLYATMAED